MNENSNEPQPTSFQAGEPLKADESFQGGAPGRPDDSGEWDESVDSGSPSQLDRAVEAVKAYERYGLAVGVALQLVVLFAMIMLGREVGGGRVLNC